MILAASVTSASKYAIGISKKTRFSYLVSSSRSTDASSISNRRYFWQEIVRKNEDIEAVAERMERAENSEGIDDRRKETHEKPTARRKRLKGELDYRIKKEKVIDVVKYVKWKKDINKK